MTTTACPHGCGGSINTAITNYCPSCRRGLNETYIIIDETLPMIVNGISNPIISPTAYKISWCWEWFGPSEHRMRCRLPKNHNGEHDCSEDGNHIRGKAIIISLDRKIIE